MAEKQKERVQFDFAPEALERLDNLKKKTGATTRAEVVRNALRIYEFLAEIDPENTIQVLDKNEVPAARFKAKLLLLN